MNELPHIEIMDGFRLWLSSNTMDGTSIVYNKIAAEPDRYELRIQGAYKGFIMASTKPDVMSGLALAVRSTLKNLLKNNDWKAGEVVYYEGGACQAIDGTKYKLYIAASGTVFKDTEEASDIKALMFTYSDKDPYKEPEEAVIKEAFIICDKDIEYVILNIIRACRDVINRIAKEGIAV